ncbi:MAG: 18 kDa heat shock protein [Chlamydiae bacterium]|nr:18 kDa heat shock protein [Chlamydiota bacterium]
MSEEKKHVPRSFWSFPRSRVPFSHLESMDDDWNLHEFSNPSGLSVSEDDDHVYIEAAIPGIKSDEIDLSFSNGILWIKAEKKEEIEDKKKKFYRKAMSAFSYRIAVPGDIDESKEPEAFCKNGVLKVLFSISRKELSKKIPIKHSDD